MAAPAWMRGDRVGVAEVSWQAWSESHLKLAPFLPPPCLPGAFLYPVYLIYSSYLF